jgi:putative peptidoglycan lipid II flippase
MLSGLAADREFGRFRAELGRTVRLALVIIVPLAVAIACLGQQLATIADLTGNLKGGTESIGWTIQAFAIAMVAFTVHYLMLRGFYANEDTRTPFFIQVVIATVNIAAAIALTSMVEPARVAMMLALSYGIAYLVGSILSTTVLSRTVGSLVDREMVVFAGKLILAAGIAAAAMLGIAAALDSAGLDQASPSGGLPTAIIAGTGGAIAYVIATKLLRMEQLTYLVKTLRRRG